MNGEEKYIPNPPTYNVDFICDLCGRETSVQNQPGIILTITCTCGQSSWFNMPACFRERFIKKSEMKTPIPEEVCYES